jgi:hypothetical protein
MSIPKVSVALQPAATHLNHTFSHQPQQPFTGLAAKIRRSRQRPLEGALLPTSEVDIRQ